MLQEKSKVCTGMLVCHVPRGPTAFFRLTNFKMSHEIAGHGVKSKHRPELILNNFNTRLGHRVARMFGSMFPHVRPAAFARRPALTCRMTHRTRNSRAAE